MREIKFRAWSNNKKEMFYPAHNAQLFNLTPFCDFEVMQYTGVKDKNGKKIFEGDTIRGNIIEYSLETMGEVEYNLEYASYVNRNDAGDTMLIKINNIEVIGNKYEGQR